MIESREAAAEYLFSFCRAEQKPYGTKKIIKKIRYKVARYGPRKYNRRCNAPLKWDRTDTCNKYTAAGKLFCNTHSHYHDRVDEMNEYYEGDWYNDYI